MALCKNCGKQLIISGGKCAYCGASPYDIPKIEDLLYGRFTYQTREMNRQPRETHTSENYYK